MENPRRCRRCLLSELDRQTYLRELKSRIDAIPARDKTLAREYARRLELCRSCDYLGEGTCLACGCYVELRAAFKTGRCPYKKWPA